MAEVAVRSRQEAFKWLERSAPRRRMRSPRAALAFGLDAGSFFAGATDAHTRSLIAEHAPEAAREVIEAAEDVRAGRFSVFGSPVSFGDPIDWHLDPIAGVRAPLVHWSRIDVLDRRLVGDSKIPWELNRQQWLVGLGQAYRLTGDERYPPIFVRSVRAWLRANPRGVGINWASSLEAALRLISWSWALTLFDRAPGVTDDFVAEVLAAAADHAAHVERFLSYYYAPNTHLTGEALGLLYAGLLLAGDRRAGRWQQRGVQILTEQCERQIGPDGAYCEHSTCYQRYTAEIYLHAMILASQNGWAFPVAVRERVQALLDNLLWVRAPNGSMPMIGDADGGWLLPLAKRRPDDLRGIFSTAAAWFGRAEFADAAGGDVAPETLWLLGAPGLDAFEAIQAAVPRAAASRLFPDGGTVTMRASWRSDAHQLVFDVAPLARFGHTHADLLGVQCAVFGEPYIIDAGTYTYTADAAWRDYFRSTAAHSTVTLDGLGQATPDRPFSWKGRPVTRVHDWHSTAELDYADASHDAYRNLPDPVVHRRRVLFAKPRYWVLVDDLAGRAHHRIELRFQFAPLEVTLEPSGWVRVSGSGGQGLLLRTFSSAHLELSLHSGSLDPLAGWISRDYGQRQPAPMLRCSAAAQLPLRIVTVLLPVGDIAARPPAITAQFDPRGAIGGLAFDLTDERIQISDESVSLVGAGNARS